jgi:hypothetical protein
MCVDEEKSSKKVLFEKKNTPKYEYDEKRRTMLI